MIILSACRLLNNEDLNYKVKFNYKVIKRWKNDELDNFNFNYLEPEEWRKYLKDTFRLSNGMKLPIKSEFDEEIVYEVRVMGLPKFLIDRARYFSGESKTRFLNLFPGYPESDKRDKDGKIKPLPTWKYGKLN